MGTRLSQGNDEYNLGFKIIFGNIAGFSMSGLDMGRENFTFAIPLQVYPTS